MLGEILAHVVGLTLTALCTYVWLLVLYIVMAFFDMLGDDKGWRKSMWFLQLSIVSTIVLVLVVHYSTQGNPASESGFIAMFLGYLLGIALYIPHHRYGFFPKRDRS